MEFSSSSSSSSSDFNRSSLSRVDQSLSSRIGVGNRGRDMAKGIEGSMSPWMEVVPALLVPALDRSFRRTTLEMIAEDQEAEDLDDDE